MIEKITDVDLIKQLWRPYTKELGIPYKDYIQDRVDAGAFFCYKVDDHIAGICTYDIYNRKKEVAVESLIVFPEYRGRGISTRLIYHMFKETESLIKTLNYKFVVEAQEGLPNNAIYRHLSVDERHFTSKSGKTNLVTYELNIPYLEDKFKDLTDC